MEESFVGEKDVTTKKKTLGSFSQHYKKDWENLQVFKGWLAAVPGNKHKAFCKFCKQEFRAHRTDLRCHAKSKKHQKASDRYTKKHSQDFEANLEFSTSEKQSPTNRNNIPSQSCIDDSIKSQLQTNEPSKSQLQTIEHSKLQLQTIEPSKLQLLTNELSKSQLQTIEHSKLQLQTIEPSKLQLLTNEPSKSQLQTIEHSKLQLQTIEPSKLQSLTNELNKSQLQTIEPSKLQLLTNELSNSQLQTNEPSKSQLQTIEHSKLQLQTIEPSKLQLLTNEPSKSQLQTIEHSKLQLQTIEPSKLQSLTNEPSKSQLQAIEHSKPHLKINNPITSQSDIIRSSPSLLQINESNKSQMQINKSDTFKFGVNDCNNLITSLLSSGISDSKNLQMCNLHGINNTRQLNSNAIEFQQAAIESNNLLPHINELRQPHLLEEPRTTSTYNESSEQIIVETKPNCLFEDHHVGTALDSMSNTGALKSSGMISTQVMDLTRGSPLGQITVGLFLMRNKKWVQLAESETDQNGRLSSFSQSTGLVVGQYKLHFKTNNIFTRTNMFPYIEVTFDVCNPNEHYHLTLLLSPFGYMVFRGG